MPVSGNARICSKNYTVHMRLNKFVCLADPLPLFGNIFSSAVRVLVTINFLCCFRVKKRICVIVRIYPYPCFTVFLGELICYCTIQKLSDRLGFHGFLNEHSSSRCPSRFPLLIVTNVRIVRVESSTHRVLFF